MDYPGKPVRKQFRSGILRICILTGVCFAVFLVLVEAFWPEGSHFLRETVSYTRNIIPVSALEVFAEDLRVGDSVFHAFRDFCRSLLR